VQRASEALAARLGSYAGGATILSTKGGEKFGMKAVINKGDHLEHFHSYYAPKSKNSGGGASKADATIDWHVDQGLVLLFTPGQQDDKSTSGFFIQLKDGSAVEVDFDAALDDLVIMLGDGMDQYFNPVLKEGHQLRAVPHALTLPKAATTKPRLWYGRMVLPPPAALFSSAAGQHPEEDATFGDLRKGMVRQDATSLNLGCASERMVARDIHTLSEGQTSNDEENPCDSEYSIYCWNRCMYYNSTDYNPDQVTPDSCASEGEELLCTKDDLIWIPGLHDHGYAISCGNPDEMTMATLSPTSSTSYPTPAPTPEDWLNRCSESNPEGGLCLNFGSRNGRTEVATGYLSRALDVCATGLVTHELEENPFTGDFSNCDSIIVGTPTYNTGEDEKRSRTTWDEWLYDVLPNIDIKGKKFAVFCTGDQNGYAEYYCDASGELHQMIKDAGGEMFGYTSQDGYYHTATRANTDKGGFIGLMLDERNQADQTDGRVDAWIEQLTEEGFFGTGDHDSHDHDEEENDSHDVDSNDHDSHDDAETGDQDSHDHDEEENDSHDADSHDHDSHDDTETPPEHLRGSRVAVA